MMINGESGSRAENDYLTIQDDTAEAVTEGKALKTWKVLIVDDDPDVHQATAFALRGLIIEDRPVSLVHAHSAGDALERITDTPDIAVALLDVVMETEDAGLAVIKKIRELPGGQALRIILRTGQPGYAPELETIRHYDINDYKTKSELTRTRLYTSLTAAIRAYSQMKKMEEMRAGLEMVVEASTELNQKRGLERFAEGVVEQLCALLSIEPEGLICAQAGGADNRESLHIIAAAGRYSNLIEQPLANLGNPGIQKAIERCLKKRCTLYDHGLTLYFSTENGGELVAFVETGEEIEENNRHLLDVFGSNMAVGFDNVALYERLQDQAYLDPLLLIPNLNKMLELLAEPPLSRGERNFAILDIDDFSAINDILGHDFGDDTLRGIYCCLRERLEESVIARTGSDRFGVLGPSSEVNPENLLSLFDEPFTIQGNNLRLSATIGLVALPDGIPTDSEILKNANLALKQAKKRKRGAAVYFSEKMGIHMRERMHLVRGMRTAFEEQHFFLVYQPKISLADGKPSGLEALLRWQTGDGEFVAPDYFVPLAEQTGFMLIIGTFVLRSACLQLARLREKGYTSLTMAINVSQLQLQEENFIQVLENVIQDYNIPADKIELEITESMAADDPQEIRELLLRIRNIGVGIALDDFGTGFSSLSVLKYLPVGRLKIDRCFISEMEQNDSIARVIIGLGKSLGMSVTAEGVETGDQYRSLQALGCDEAQGWFFSYPLEEGPLMEWLDTVFG
ncbi:EAL domain-containing protein [Marispirochaeta sp.]|jgi:diguanylate cyclase|uniref:bifunctional diguanylate cyclase/phosphodiesterase n=1 Tax=Marispirochaeta sp. TaxID=2038653 RepID=UPI0029C73BF0|nr:EAL domain-containing protein [Marispirochaeta sp.]